MHKHAVYVHSKRSAVMRNCFEDEETCVFAKATPEEIGWFYDKSNFDQSVSSFNSYLADYRERVVRNEARGLTTGNGATMGKPPFDPEDVFAVSGDGVYQNGDYYPMDETSLNDLLEIGENKMREQIPPEFFGGHKMPTTPIGFEQEVLAGDHRADYQAMAKNLVRVVVDSRHPLDKLPAYEVYIVWFAKTLQNWKALVGTTMADGLYFEVTFNGDKNETYVDVYQKVEHVVFDGSKDWENDQNVCTDPACTYMEPHKHGFACTGACHCNRQGRVD